MSQEAQVVKWNCPCGNTYKFHGFTKAPQRQPLTDEQIGKWWASENGLEDCRMSKFQDFRQVVRAIEAKLKQKNGYAEEKNNG